MRGHKYHLNGSGSNEDKGGRVRKEKRWNE